MRILKFSIIILLLIVTGTYLSYEYFFNKSSKSPFEYESDNSVDKATVYEKMVDNTLNYFDEIKDQDGVKTLIDLSLTEQVAPDRNDIPPLDEPVFVTASSADRWLSEDMKVAFYLGDNGTKVAYPLALLRWHQVVIDDVDGRSIAVTYCPFSGVLAAYDRSIFDLIKMDFAVSGKVFNSNTLLYDKQTETLWQQLSGQAVSGDLAGKSLTKLPISLMDWGSVKFVYPEVQVLSRRTDLGRDYLVKPYGNYDSSRDLYYKVKSLNTTFHPKSIGIGLSLQNEDSKIDRKIYLLEEIRKLTYVNDRINGVPVFIFEDPESHEFKVYKRDFDDKTYSISFKNGNLVSTEGNWKIEKDGLVLEIPEEIKTEEEMKEAAIKSESEKMDEENDNEDTEAKEESKEVILERIPVIYTYWFAWMAFYPDSRFFTTDTNWETNYGK